MNSVRNPLYIYGNNNNDLYTSGYFNMCTVDRIYQQKNSLYCIAFRLLIMCQQ
jgi:hypothetical protein